MLNVDSGRPMRAKEESFPEDVLNGSNRRIAAVRSKRHLILPTFGCGRGASRDKAVIWRIWVKYEPPEWGECTSWSLGASSMSFQ
jgi:hypothetical protein